MVTLLLKSGTLRALSKCSLVVLLQDDREDRGADHSHKTDPAGYEAAKSTCHAYEAGYQGCVTDVTQPIEIITKRPTALQHATHWAATAVHCAAIWPALGCSQTFWPRLAWTRELLSFDYLYCKTSSVQGCPTCAT